MVTSNLARPYEVFFYTTVRTCRVFRALGMPARPESWSYAPTKVDTFGPETRSTLGQQACMHGAVVDAVQYCYANKAILGSLHFKKLNKLVYLSQTWVAFFERDCQLPFFVNSFDKFLRHSRP